MGIELSSKQDVAKREDEGQLVHLRDEFGEPWLENGSPVTVTVVGTYSTRYRRAEAAAGRRFQKQMRSQGGDFDMRAYNEDVAAQCITAWTEFTDNGQPTTPTRELVLRLFAAMPWIYPQVNAAMENHAAFFGKASPSSPSA